MVESTLPKNWSYYCVLNKNTQVSSQLTKRINSPLISCFIQVVVQNQRASVTETIEIPQSSSMLPEVDGSEKDDIDDAEQLLMLFIKDRYGVSHEAYHEMAKACKQLPRQCQLQRRIKALNENWEIEMMPNGIAGVQQKLQPRLTARLQHLITSTPEDALFKKNKKISVKLLVIDVHTYTYIYSCINMYCV